MAKITKLIHGDFQETVDILKEQIIKGSISASLEDENYSQINEVDCAVLVFERFSYFGKNRVSLNITLLHHESIIQLIAVAAGGSQASFFKLNTIGEENFLYKLQDILDKYFK